MATSSRIARPFASYICHRHYLYRCCNVTTVVPAPVTRFSTMAHYPNNLTESEPRFWRSLFHKRWIPERLHVRPQAWFGARLRKCYAQWEKFENWDFGFDIYVFLWYVLIYQVNLTWILFSILNFYLLLRKRTFHYMINVRMIFTVTMLDFQNNTLVVSHNDKHIIFFIYTNLGFPFFTSPLL